MPAPNSIQLARSSGFEKAFKKLSKPQKADVIVAIEHLLQHPLDGELKIGDIGAIRVYKFRMVKQQTLLAYYYYEQRLVLHLLMFGPHENFYRDLKNQIN